MDGMAPQIDHGWSALNETADLRKKIALLELRLERLEKTMAHVIPDKSDDI